jgi:ATP-dependent DNA helicase DinG
MPDVPIDGAVGDGMDDVKPVVEALHVVVDGIGGEQREGQERMATIVARAIADRTHAVVQAGTGTGKSVGYLVPAALHATSPGSGSVIVATATLALQRQLIDRDLPRIAESLDAVLDRPVTYAVLKGRNNYVCLQRLHGSGEDDDSEALFDAPASALGRQAKALREWAESTTTGDRDDYPDELDPRVWRAFSVGRRECVGEARCAYGEECFTALRRQQAMEADIVVTNHAMLAIDSIEGVPVLPEHDAVIVDEAHELVDRATAAVTAELSVSVAERAVSGSRRLVDPETHERMTVAVETLDDALRAQAAQMSGPTRVEAWPRGVLLAFTMIRDALHQGISEVNADREVTDPQALASRQRAVGSLQEVHDVAGALLGLGSRDVAWLDPGEAGAGRAPVVRLAPLSVAGLLRDSLFASGSVVLTSATLSVGGEFASLLASAGLADDTLAVDVGSPFDHGRQGILYVAKHLPAPGRDGVPMEALDELADLVEAAGGRTLALFSSWRGVERAADYLRVRWGSRPDLPVLVQQRGDSVAGLVERFASVPESTLLGTVSLWQGVDVPGESCSLVVIDRIPFPRPDNPLLAARQRAVDEAGGSGFASVSVPRAGLLLAQGAGRLIRSAEDRGVVAVLDSRLATAAYGRALRASLPPFWYTTDRVTVLGSLDRLREEFTAD